MSMDDVARCVSVCLCEMATYLACLIYACIFFSSLICQANVMSKRSKAGWASLFRCLRLLTLSTDGPCLSGLVSRALPHFTVWTLSWLACFAAILSRCGRLACIARSLIDPCGGFDQSWGTSSDLLGPPLWRSASDLGAGSGKWLPTKFCVVHHCLLLGYTVGVAIARRRFGS